MFAYTEVGMLNTFVELWRYPSSQACMEARQAARGVAEWKEAIAAVTPNVQWFRSTLIRPVWWSKWM
jgi:NIPSNAP